MAPQFLTSTLDGDQFQAFATLRRGKSPPPPAPNIFEQKVRWASDPVWMMWSREQYVVLAGVLTRDVQPATGRPTDWVKPRTLRTR
jgi:hypothetical protein